jgi:pimeloyl-ACP methyl ester carboxylesterase
MLAAYADKTAKPAGLVLLAAGPSLSAAIRMRFQSHLILAPLSVLPLAQLLPHDYSLMEGLARSPDVPVVLFQGTRDEQAPIEILRNAGLPKGVQLVEVPEATHSTTFALSQASQISSVLNMLRTAGP